MNIFIIIALSSLSDLTINSSETEVVKGPGTTTSDIMSDLTITAAAEKAEAEQKERQRKAAAVEEAKKIAAEKAAAEEKEPQRKAATEEQAKKVAAVKAAAEVKQRQRKAAAEEEAKKIAAEKAAAAEEKQRQRQAVAEEEAKKIAAEKILQSEQSASFGFAPRPLATGKLTHVFLTHNWSDDEDGRNSHARVARINKALQRRGFITWFDEEKIDTAIRDEMTDGIEKTHCVVVCITKIYQDKVNSRSRKDNCYFEFDYASRHLPDEMIPVVMEPCMINKSMWNGRLNSELGGLLYVDMSKDEESIFERKCDELATRINKSI
jgi:flagellar biosynthesis GTPase FlhF